MLINLINRFNSNSMDINKCKIESIFRDYRSSYIYICDALFIINDTFEATQFLLKFENNPIREDQFIILWIMYIKFNGRENIRIHPLSQPEEHVALFIFWRFNVCVGNNNYLLRTTTNLQAKSKPCVKPSSIVLLHGDFLMVVWFQIWLVFSSNSN